MAWLKSNWQWTALNLVALALFVEQVERGPVDWSQHVTTDPILESGKWAIRLLLVSLAMTPLYTYLGWNRVVKLRKPAGLWAFAFALLHVALQMRETGLDYLTLPLEPLIVFGLPGLLILAALALTSNRQAMRFLGKNWKRLHRAVYIAGGAVAVHAVLATTMSKRVSIIEPEAIREMSVYLALLVLLLVLRLAPVRRLMKGPGGRFRVRRAARAAPLPRVFPDETPDSVPEVYWRELDLLPWEDESAADDPSNAEVIVRQR